MSGPPKNVTIPGVPKLMLIPAQALWLVPSFCVQECPSASATPFAVKLPLLLVTTKPSGPVIAGPPVGPFTAGNVPLVIGVLLRAQVGDHDPVVVMLICSPAATALVGSRVQVCPVSPPIRTAMSRS